MPDRPNLIYRYDGSFDGLLCCVFESYASNEIPEDILSPVAAQTSIFPAKEVTTDAVKAGRVLTSIPKKLGKPALDFVKHGFLTCLPHKELHILVFLRLGFRVGDSVMNMLADDDANTLFKAVRALENESGHLMGFVRFSDFHSALVAEIEPKNIVLPLLAQHFCERMPDEKFLIHDKTNGMVLVYQPYSYSIIPIEDLQLPVPDEEELSVRRLWRLFYDTIEVEGRHNPKCRMSHMPKRFWKYLTEFDDARPTYRFPGIDTGANQLQLPEKDPHVQIY